ncbi:MAG: NTP transferase domain-containing protein [Firmicutes bacterium]|nr:NTP transferase domain-containing protein [Bacillota bacterium]
MTSKRVRIVLQARTTSSRLPAKVLLPLGGMPLAILCAKRLNSSGHEVVLATSNSASDDFLAANANRAGIQVFRGSLDDVLSRFLDCTSDLKDDDLVVRATADNPLPDGDFVEQLISAFERSGQDYLGTSSPSDGLPYGLSAEIFTIGALRKKAKNNQDLLAREHVTTELRREAGTNGIVPQGLFLDKDYSDLRVTVDTLEDYLFMVGLFQHVICPERIPWHHLIEKLISQKTSSKMIPYKVENNIKFSCITLGTAQLGFNYGIANSSGCPSDEEACKILSLAKEAGVTHLDTARAYGNAETRIGHLLPGRVAEDFHIISKLHPITNIPNNASVTEIASAVDASIYCSCRELKRPYIDVMMFHRYADMVHWNGAAMDRLSAHVKNGVIGEIGVSVYTPEEAMNSIADERVSHIQIPFNLLDDRWTAQDFLQALEARDNLKIHARSIFLQGLLLNEAEVWPQWATESHELVGKIEELTQLLNRKNKIDLCMSYVRAFPWVTSLVVGVESAKQLAEILVLTHEQPLTQEECAIVQEVFRGVPQRLLNPSLW